MPFRCMHHVIRMTPMQIHECIRMESRLLLHKYQLLVINSYTAVLRFAMQPASGIPAAGVGCSWATECGGYHRTKQQYGGYDPQEVKVYGGCGPYEVDVLRVPPAGCKSTAGVTCSKLRLVRVEPAGETDFLRGALEPHTPGHHVPYFWGGGSETSQQTVAP
jgi:hypothetical protein